jgi:hypothetical protein
MRAESSRGLRPASSRAETSSEQLHHNLPEMESSSAFKFSCIVTLLELAVSVGHLGFG